MTSLVLQDWRAWAPSDGGDPLASHDDWRAWANDPKPLGSDGQPDVPFLPSGVRRRATRLTRMMVQVAFDCTDDANRDRVRTVFASRHGAIHVAMKIVGSIARGEMVSPLQFSHSVHNAQAGLFSIAAANREASSSIAAGEDTFSHAFLEAALHFERAPEQPVLLVIGDEPLPETLAHLVEEPPGAYAVALLLAREGDGTRLEFGLEPTHAPRKDRAWPDALEFVRFLHGSDPELVLESRRRRWHWTRR